MAEESVFREVLAFFDKLGVYDVILPFLLVFTIMFAILDKTKIFGTEEVGGQKYSRKNLNAMVAFISAFLVVASSNLVATVNETIAHISLLIIISVGFLILIGVFHKEGEDVYLAGKWRNLFMILMFIAIILISLNAIKTSEGESWFMTGYEWIMDNWSNEVGGSIILLIIIIVFISLIMKEAGPKKALPSAEKKT